MCSKTYHFFSITIAIRILQELFYEEMEYCTFFLFFFFYQKKYSIFYGSPKKSVTVWANELITQITWGQET